MYAFNAAASSYRRQFLQLVFNKFVQSPQSPAFIRKFVTCSITFKNVQIFQLNSIFFVQTQVYTEQLTSNRRLLPSNAYSIFKLVSE